MSYQSFQSLRNGPSSLTSDRIPPTQSRQIYRDTSKSRTGPTDSATYTADEFDIDRPASPEWTRRADRSRTKAQARCPDFRYAYPTGGGPSQTASANTGRTGTETSRYRSQEALFEAPTTSANRRVQSFDTRVSPSTEKVSSNDDQQKSAYSKGRKGSPRSHGESDSNGNARRPRKVFSIGADSDSEGE